VCVRDRIINNSSWSWQVHDVALSHLRYMMLEQNTTIPSTVEGHIAVTVRTANCSVNDQLLNVLSAGMSRKNRVGIISVVADCMLT
jgi:hypothetical protein